MAANDDDDDEHAIGAAFDVLRRHLVAQTANGWPDKLTLPKAESPAEHRALSLFLEVLRSEGVPIGVG